MLLVELLIDVGNLINEGLIEVSHDHLRTRNLTGDVIRLLSSIGKLGIHRFEIGINLLIDLGDQIQHLTLHLSELFLNVPLEWRGIVLDYFGESFLVALEFYHTNDILQTADNLVMLFLLRIITRKFFEGGCSHECPLSGQMYGIKKVQAEETFALRCCAFC